MEAYSTDVLANYELTIAQFYEYNPAVGSDCGNLWPSKSATPNHLSNDSNMQS